MSIPIKSCGPYKFARRYRTTVVKIFKTSTTFEMDNLRQPENFSERSFPHNFASQDTLVHTKSNGNRQWSVLQKVLLALVVIFFVAFIVFVVLYADKLSDDDGDDDVDTKGN